MRMLQTAQEQLKQENKAFRYLYGFGILFVVLSHCDGGGFEMLSNWMHFGAFHLAIFVFGSGYFLAGRTVTKPVAFIWKKVKKLLVPLWLWNVVYGLLLLILQKIGFTYDATVNIKTLLLSPINSFQLFILDMGAWFVFPFFMVQFLYILGASLLGLLHKKQITDPVWQLLYLVMGVWIVYASGQGLWENMPQPLCRIAYFMPFYILGMWYHNYLEKYIDRLSVTGLLSGCLIMALLLNAHFGRVVYAIPSSCDYPFGVVATYLSACIGILFWLTVSKALERMTEDVKILRFMGNHTWDIMFHQFLGILMVKALFFLCSRCFGIFVDFDKNAFLSDIWYLYLPKQMAEFKALYVVGAIAFSVLVGKAVTWCKNKIIYYVNLQRWEINHESAVN